MPAAAFQYGQKIVIPKALLPHAPAGFSLSGWSLPIGQIAAYRQDCPRDSIQLRDYGAFWVAELDRYNPSWGLVEFIGHAVLDALPVTVLVMLSVAFFRRRPRGR